MLTLCSNLGAGGATTQFTNCRFVSMVRFNGVVLCAGRNGLYRMSSSHDRDENAAIASHITLPMSDYGSRYPKRFRTMFLGYQADGDLTLTSTTEKKVFSHTTDIQLSNDDYSGNHIGRRIFGARSMLSRYWSFKISNVGGCFFRIFSLSGEAIQRYTLFMR